MSKSLATPILHFAQAAQLNNQPSVLHPFNCKLIGKSMFPFLGLFRHFCKQGFQLWFFFPCPITTFTGKLPAQRYHTKKQHTATLQPIQSKTERVVQKCVSRNSGDQSGRIKAPGAPCPRGGKSTKSRRLKQTLHWAPAPCEWNKERCTRRAGRARTAPYKVWPEVLRPCGDSQRGNTNGNLS